MNFVHISSYDNYLNAHMQLSLLQEQGINCHLKDEHTVTIDPLLSPAIGGMKLMVAEPQAKRAMEILDEAERQWLNTLACPTCGRLQFDMDTVVAEIEERLEAYEEHVEVAVLGCAVNGIGEASHADFGITGAKNEGLIFAHGKPLRKVKQEELVDALFAEIDKSLDRGKVHVDEEKSREGADWLAKIVSPPTGGTVCRYRMLPNGGSASQETSECHLSPLARLDWPSVWIGSTSG